MGWAESLCGLGSHGDRALDGNDDSHVAGLIRIWLTQLAITYGPNVRMSSIFDIRSSSVGRLLIVPIIYHIQLDELCGDGKDYNPLPERFDCSFANGIARFYHRSFTPYIKAGSQTCCHLTLISRHYILVLREKHPRHIEVCKWQIWSR